MSASLTAEQPEQIVGSQDEGQLIEQAQRDPAALTLLYRMHRAAIHGYVLRRVGNGHDADDLTAEVFLAMVRALPRYRWRGAPLRAWLYRLATNEVNRWARKRRRSAMRQITEQTCEQVAVADATESPWDLEFVQLALLSLPPRFQAVLSLFYLEDMPVADIAQVLGCRARHGQVTIIARTRVAAKATRTKKGSP